MLVKNGISRHRLFPVSLFILTVWRLRVKPVWISAVGKWFFRGQDGYQRRGETVYNNSADDSILYMLYMDFRKSKGMR